MKPARIVLSLVLLFSLASCTLTGAFTAKTLTINDALDTIDALDAKHDAANANFRTERIPIHLVDENALDDLLADVRAEHTRFSAGAIPDDKKLIDHLFVAREEMLLSQQYYHQSAKLGTAAIVADSILCKDAPNALELARLLDLTRKHGTNATRAFDNALQELSNRQDLRTIDRIGISDAEKDERPRWYFSPFREMTAIIERNQLAVEKYCS